jgi:hypothetical protein
MNLDDTLFLVDEAGESALATIGELLDVARAGPVGPWVNRRHMRHRVLRTDLGHQYEGITVRQTWVDESAESAGPLDYLACVHDQGKARWGPNRRTLAEAQSDRLRLQVQLRQIETGISVTEALVCGVCVLSAGHRNWTEPH